VYNLCDFSCKILFSAKKAGFFFINLENIENWRSIIVGLANILGLRRV